MRNKKEKQTGYIMSKWNKEMFWNRKNFSITNNQRNLLESQKFELREELKKIIEEEKKKGEK